MVEPMTQKLVWISIIMFPIFVSITQFSNFWVMSYGNWKHILVVFNFHNSVFNNIFVIKHTWRDPLVRSAAPFDPFFFAFFSTFLSSPRFGQFVLSSYLFLFFPFRQNLVSSFFLLFFFLVLHHKIFSVFSSFFLLFFFSSSFTGFRFLDFFSTGFDEFGYRGKKKPHQVTDMGLTNSVKILGDDKWVMVPNE